MAFTQPPRSMPTQTPSKAKAKSRTSAVQAASRNRQQAQQQRPQQRSSGPSAPGPVANQPRKPTNPATGGSFTPPPSGGGKKDKDRDRRNPATGGAWQQPPPSSIGPGFDTQATAKYTPTMFGMPGAAGASATPRVGPAYPGVMPGSYREAQANQPTPPARPPKTEVGFETRGGASVKYNPGWEAIQKAARMGADVVRTVPMAMEGQPGMMGAAAPMAQALVDALLPPQVVPDQRAAAQGGVGAGAYLPTILKEPAAPANVTLPPGTPPVEALQAEADRLTGLAGSMGVQPGLTSQQEALNVPWSLLGFDDQFKGAEWANSFFDNYGYWPWEGPNSKEENLGRNVAAYYTQGGEPVMNEAQVYYDPYAEYANYVPEGAYLSPGYGGGGYYGGGYGGGYAGSDPAYGQEFNPWWYAGMARGV